MLKSLLLAVVLMSLATVSLAAVNIAPYLGATRARIEKDLGKPSKIRIWSSKPGDAKPAECTYRLGSIGSMIASYDSQLKTGKLFMLKVSFNKPPADWKEAVRIAGWSDLSKAEVDHIHRAMREKDGKRVETDSWTARKSKATKGWAVGYMKKPGLGELYVMSVPAQFRSRPK